MISPSSLPANMTLTVRPSINISFLNPERTAALLTISADFDRSYLLGPRELELLARAFTRPEQLLANAWKEVLDYDRIHITEPERVPDGDDYNEIFNIIQYHAGG